MLFDTHAHMNDPAFDTDRDAVLTGLPEQGVKKLVNIGCDLESSRQSVELAQRYPHVYAAVGTHPDSADHVNGTVIEEYRKLCKLCPKIKAIGEIGLDYYYEDIPRQIQKTAFIAQLELARELKLPVVVHERDAHEDAMDIIRQFPDVTGVFHCYSGSAEMAKQLVSLGWYIGFTGVLTFKNARKAVQTAQSIALERIVIETDCPYMSPEPYRGRRNDPSRVRFVTQKLAALRGISVEEAQRITYENGMRLYRIEE